jgi:hypothetical protein
MIYQLMTVVIGRQMTTEMDSQVTILTTVTQVKSTTVKEMVKKRDW